MSRVTKASENSERTGNRKIGDMNKTMTSSSPIASVANALINTRGYRSRAPGRNR